MFNNKYLNLVISFFLVIIFVASALIFSSEFNLLSKGEQGWIEISTALIYFFSAIFLIIEKRYLVGGLLFLFFLEESSFFLWFFYYDTSKISLINSNVQFEPNLHNLEIFQSGSFFNLTADIVNNGFIFMLRPYYLFLIWIIYIIVIAPFNLNFFQVDIFRRLTSIISFGGSYFEQDKAVGVCFLILNIILLLLIYPFPDSRNVLGELRELCYSFFVSIFFISRLFLSKVTNRGF
jgi:hypothetical protein